MTFRSLIAGCLFLASLIIILPLAALVHIGILPRKPVEFVIDTVGDYVDRIDK